MEFLEFTFRDVPHFLGVAFLLAMVLFTIVSSIETIARAFRRR